MKISDLSSFTTSFFYILKGTDDRDSSRTVYHISHYYDPDETEHKEEMAITHEEIEQLYDILGHLVKKD